MPPNYQTDHQLLQEVYRLTRENNDLIHAMRRSAFIRSLLTVVFYVVVFAAPIWLYMSYFSGTVDSLIRNTNQQQGSQPSSSNAPQDQLKNLTQMLQNLQAAYSGNPPPTSTHQ